MSKPTPSWFIGDSECNTVGTVRSQQRAVDHLKAVFPHANEATLRTELKHGGDLDAVAARLLRLETGEASSTSDEPRQRAVLSIPRANTAAAAAAASAASAADDDDDVGAGRFSRISFAESDTPKPDMLVEPETAEELSKQSLAQLAAGALRLEARVVRTANELEQRLTGEKIVTKFVIEVKQLGYTWEVARRYSEWAAFHEALVADWVDIPVLPSKHYFSQECSDIAERMVQLDGYLRKLFATPAVMLSAQVCSFLDAMDEVSFRVQLNLKKDAPLNRRLHRFQREEPVAAAEP